MNTDSDLFLSNLSRNPIVIEKLEARDFPRFATPNWEEFHVGEDNGDFSIPSGYVVQGILLAPIIVGQSVRVLRTARNGEFGLGIFASSPVTAVRENTFETENSVYRYYFPHD